MFIYYGRRGWGVQKLPPTSTTLSLFCDLMVEPLIDLVFIFRPKDLYYHPYHPQSKFEDRGLSI